MFRHEDSQNCLGKNKYINNIRQFKQSQIDKKETIFFDKSEFITDRAEHFTMHIKEKAINKINTNKCLLNLNLQKFLISIKSQVLKNIKKMLSILSFW